MPQPPLLGPQTRAVTRPTLCHLVASQSLRNSAQHHICPMSDGDETADSLLCRHHCPQVLADRMPSFPCSSPQCQGSSCQPWSEGALALRARSSYPARRAPGWHFLFQTQAPSGAAVES